MRYLLLDGPLNGRYASLAEAEAAGYTGPDLETAQAWNFEPIMVW